MSISFVGMKLSVLLCVLVFCWIPFSTSKHYSGYKLYRVTFQGPRAQEVVSLVDKIDGADMWRMSSAEGTADVFVAPNVNERLLSELRREGLAFTVINGDVQGDIDGTVVA